MPEPSLTSVLDGINVLNTRPAHQAEPLSDLIREQGGNSIELPVLEILDPEDNTKLLEQVKRLAEFDIAIFISPNAVAKAMNLIHSQGGIPEHVQVATIGRASAKEMKKLLERAPDISPKTRFDSESLLELPEMQDISGKKIIIFRGGRGREHLANELIKRGATVEYAEAYRRGRPKGGVGKILHMWARGEVHVIAITSSEGLHNLYDMVGKLGRAWLIKTPLVVVSERMIPVAKELGFTHEPVVAEEASNEAIMEALARWQAASSAEQSTAAK